MCMCGNVQNQLNRLKRVEKLHRHKSQPIFFLKPPKWNGAKHVTFQPEFPAFPCKWYDPPRFDKKFSFPGAVSNFRGFLAGKDKKFPQVRPMP